MATKTIAWTTGSGNITLTYTGQGNGSISVASDENTDFEPRQQSFKVVTTNGTPEQAIDILVLQAGKTYPVGEVFNFDYTGSVQQITLPKGKYKLQCWGAQGGTSYGSSNGAGSKGGYSEGVLTLTEKTTLYIFVGGQGSRGSSTSLVNGGWNGGGASVGYTSYNSGGTNGYSYPACGGGATDISTVTSSMSYSSGRTNRSAASLLARCIVAGGGAGGSYRYTSVTTTGTKWTKVLQGVATYTMVDGNGNYVYNLGISVTPGKVYKVTTSSTSYVEFQYTARNSSGQALVYTNIRHDTAFTATTASGVAYYQLNIRYSTQISNPTLTLYVQEATSSTSNSSGYSNQSQQGGGTSGRGQYPGTQSAGGSGSQAGGFGYGANQPTTGNRYDSGAGGGGWYGGGSYTSDSSTSAVNYSGGGSGFVNTAANSSYRPTNYTGLQLDSGTTIDGATSFESVNGGTETGHSGNGYARITVIE